MRKHLKYWRDFYRVLYSLKTLFCLVSILWLYDLTNAQMRKN